MLDRVLTVRRKRRLVIAALAGLLPVLFVAYVVTTHGLGPYDTWSGVLGGAAGGWCAVTLVTFIGLSLVSFARRMVVGHPDWPPPREFRLTFDDNGLPVLTWLEDAFQHPRRCVIARYIDTGELAFVVTDPTVAVDAPEDDPWTAWKVRAIGGGIIAMALLAGFLRSQSYSYGQDFPPMMAVAGVLVCVMILFGIYAGASALWRRWLLVTGRAPEGGIASAPWAALQGFVVSDSHSLHGARTSVGVERPNLPVMLADFGLAARRFEVSHHNWSADALTELNRILTREFIARRDEHMARIARDGFVGDDGTHYGERSQATDAAEIPVRLG